MKNTIITLSLILSFTLGYSQKSEINTLKEKSQLKSINTRTSLKEHNIIWTDNFSDASNWNIQNDEGNTQNWKITSYSPMGYYSGSMGKIKSETPHKIALMDAELLSNEESLQRAKLTVANPINCTDYSTVNVKFYSYYARLGSQIFFRISADNGETWTDYEIHADLPEWHATENPEIIYIDITEQAAGKEEVLIQFYYDGLEDNTGIAWMVDDITIYEPNGVDANILSLNNYWLMNITDSLKISTDIQNLGNETINSITFNYTVNDFISETKTVEGLNIPPFSFFRLAHPDVFLFNEEGNYTPSIQISEINGNSIEIEATGDFIEVYDNTNSKILLGELFTSSTCAPCAGFNPFYDLVQSLISPSLLNTIKYQMNWPGTGDPYYTEDGGTRKDYYNVSGVPSLYVNGTYIDLNNYGMDYIREAIKNQTPAIINLNSSINENKVSVEVKLRGTEDLSNINLLISVNEKQTYDNASTNGETEFNHVMLKMLPNANGEYIDMLRTGDSLIFNYEYDINSTNMEEINDLEVIAFVQNKDTKEIYQSKSVDLSWIVEDTTSTNIELTSQTEITLYPNPANNYISIDTGSKVDVSIFSMTGQLLLFKENYNPNETLDISNLNTGMYLITINSNYKLFSKKLIINR